MFVGGYGLDRKPGVRAVIGYAGHIDRVTGDGGRYVALRTFSGRVTSWVPAG
jgi:hypothetical protein